MDERITVEQIAGEMKLKDLTPDVNADIEIKDSDINRPALQLAGFYNYFNSRRVQIIGNVECAYLESLGTDEAHAKIETLFARGIPCLIYCRSHQPDEYTLYLAQKHGVNIYTTDESTSEMSEKIIHYLKKRMAPSITIHGVLIDVFGEGVLITGESGIGKSEAALELIKRGHRLVADDAVEIRKYDDETLIGSAPEITKDFIELRGVGVIDVKSLFGLECVKNEQQIDFVIHVEDWNKEREYDRLGNGDEYIDYLGNKVTKYSLPLRPGRNLAVIVEAVAVNYRQRSLGYNAVDELYRRVQANLIRNQEKI
ncbi:MAG: HPr(Ser) kinase/phosphatase [Lachnospiraceae bacterium]|nr:HPr(Ser) kinase/phosphatase [Lachnospiraceae bacterium]